MFGYIFNKEIETMQRSEMQNLQSERLRNLVQRMYENAPYYRKKMDEIGLKPSDIKSVDDLHKLPFTVKHDLRSNYPFDTFAVPKKEIVRVHASSGTTGKLTVVGYTKKDLETWSEVVARSYAMAGCTDESVVHIAYGYGLFTGGLGAHYGSERIGAMTVPVSSGNTARQIMLMKDFGATHLCCTPSYALYIAEEIKNAGMDMSEFNLKAGVFGAEPWSKAMKQDIENKLKIKAFDIYGLSEIIGPGVAMSCEYDEGMHIQEDHFIPEIVDPVTLEPLPYGKEGELVFTTITKEGIPLVRYRTRDITSLNAEKCKCGRTTVRMNKVLGRSDDMLIIRGVNVFPSQIESVLLKFGKGIEPQYLLVVDRVNNTDTLEIMVEMSQELFSDEVKVVEEIRANIEREIASSLGISAKIRLVNPFSIPRSEGKAKRIIDNRKI